MAAALPIMPAAKRNADYLLVDISNSYTKLAFSSTERVGRASCIPTRSLTKAALRQFVGSRGADSFVVSSVVPARNRVVASAANGARVLFLSAESKLGVGVEYPKAETIGADRLANAAAVAQLYGTPAIVVDFGTAVTFDVVSAEGNYVGGVIAPGLESMTTFLYHRTALLPKLTLQEPRRAIGKTTRAAMMSGAIYGYRGLVREILARIRAEAFPGGDVRVVATGGYAGLIARALPEIEAVHPGLTLEGLRIVGNLNIASA